jgi:redox-sensing transcriptional repressor
MNSQARSVKRIADSTVRRLSLYLRFLEDAEERGIPTISSEELARRGGTTSAQVRKDLSFFGSFGKRGLGYSVPELTKRLRDILGLGKRWRVIVIGAGKIGAALVHYLVAEKGAFTIVAAYDINPEKIGDRLEGVPIHDIADVERHISGDRPDIVVLAIPGEQAQRVVDQLVRAGIRAIFNFAPVQLQVPGTVTVKNINMALELEGLSFALSSRE